MIILNAFIEVKLEHIDQFLEITKPLITASRQETGNFMYELYQNGSKFVFIENWENKAIIDIHANTPHFKEFVEQVTPLLAKPLVIKSYTE